MGSMLGRVFRPEDPQIEKKSVSGPRLGHFGPSLSTFSGKPVPRSAEDAAGASSKEKTPKTWKRLPFLTTLGTSGGPLGVYLALFGGLWGALGLLWGLWASFWLSLATFGGLLGCLWVALGVLWAPLGRLWGSFGLPLGRLGGHFGRLWALLGCIWSPSGGK